MVTYDIQKLFTTRWVWFAGPSDVTDADEVVFFSYNEVHADGFRRKRGVTSVIDLQKTVEELWSALRKKFIRKQIIRGQTQGITVRLGTVSELFTVYHSFQNAKRITQKDIGFVAPFGDVFVAEYHGEALAVGLFLADTNYVRAYALASHRLDTAYQQMTERVGYANRMLIWEAVLHYKSKGCMQFDLGGINPESGTQENQSLREFKEAFGGERIPHFYYRKMYSPVLALMRKARARIRL